MPPSSASPDTNVIYVLVVLLFAGAGAVGWLRAMWHYERQMKEFFRRNAREASDFQRLIEDFPPEKQKYSFEHPLFQRKEDRALTRVKN